MNNDTVIKVENLTKIYKLYNNPLERFKESLHPFKKKYHREFYALNDISFEIKKGETLGIIGRNGAGKSTLLQIITGVLCPTGGNVSVEGKISALLELGAGFNPELTGMENIYFSGTIMGYSKEEIDAKVDEIIAFADIGEFIGQPMKTYSSGMFVRLAFAVAINIEPEILIVDEALSVGDMQFQAKCYRKFNEFRDANKTILFVTHSLDNILIYCDRVIVLDKGAKVVDTGPKEAIDVFKRLLADCYYNNKVDKEEKKEEEQKEEENLNIEETSLPEEEVIADENEEDRHLIEVAKASKDKFSVNSEVLSYGNNKAEIIDFGIFDKEGKPSQRLLNNEEFHISMKVEFKEDIDSPIFAYSIKTLKGLEVTGTNTLWKKIDISSCKKGTVISVEFSQTLNMFSGQYALSLGCTGYEGEDLAVYHRLYDVLLFDVVTDSLMSGFYDLHSKVEIEKLT